MTIALRPALEDDVAWLFALLTHPTTAAYLAVSDQGEAELRAELAAPGDHAGGWLPLATSVGRPP